MATLRSRTFELERRFRDGRLLVAELEDIEEVYTRLRSESGERGQRFIIEVAYQVTVAARSSYLECMDGRIDAEALVRWNERQHRLLGYALDLAWQQEEPPSEFLRAFVESQAEHLEEQRLIAWFALRAASRLMG